MPNQLTLRRYGRYRTSPDGDSGTTASGQLRACVFDPATAHMWVTKIGGFLGRASGSNPTVRFAAYETNSSMHPTSRVGYTNAVTVTNLAGSSPETQSYSATVAVADNAPTNTAFKVQSGKRYAVAYLGTGNSVLHSMVAAASIDGDNEQFYNRSGLSQPPPDPFGSYSSSVEGWLTVWLEGWENVAPDTPANLSPSGTIQTTTPTMVADFRDLNGAWGATSGNGVDTGDRLNQYQIQARRVGSSTLIWNATYSASSSEKANNRISRAWGGSSLTRGVTYEWRVRMSDQFGSWSPWSSWVQFTPATLGFVTLDGNPTGKIETNTPNFEARWTHQNGLSTNAVEIRLEDASGNLLQTSPTIAKTVASSAPGTLFTITWAETGFSALAWGTDYQYQVRGRDTNGQWSDWSDPRTFSTNAAPSIPSNLSPSNSVAVTALPRLTCTASDVDDTPSTGLVVKCRIKDTNGSTIATRTMVFNSTTGKWEYQTTTSDLASFATYRWDAYSYDGTLYSGEQTVEANAVASEEATFVYAQGPVVSVTSPADDSTITTVTPTIQWSVTAGGPQAKYRVRIFPDGGTTPLHDTGWVTSTATSYVVPSGILRNNTDYDLIVSVENTSALTGDSESIDFTVSLVPPPALTNVQVVAYRTGTDPWPTAVRLTWDQTTIPSGEFVAYVITRSVEAGPDAGTVVLARLTSPSDTAYVDWHPASGYEYTYTIQQVQQIGPDQLISEPVSGAVTITLGGLVVTLAANPESYRAYAVYRPEGGGTGRSWSRQIVETVYPPVAGTRVAPRTFRSRARWWEWVQEAELLTDRWASARQRLEEWETLDRQASLLPSAVCCVRDERGRKIFAVITDVRVTDQWPDRATIEIGFREEAYQEGAS